MRTSTVSPVSRTLARVLIAAILCASAGACRKAPEQRYQLKGKIVSVDKRGSTVTIAHDAIPGYMEAMTMPFTLKDQKLLSNLPDNSRIQATLVVAGLKSWLEDVVVTSESVDQSGLSSAQNAVEPKPGDEAPDFKLINQDGKRISLHGYPGRAVVVTFIYTRCPLPDYCPLMTENFSTIDKTLRSEPELYSKTQLLSISVDPEYDEPRVLRQYASAHSSADSHWDFASGSKDEVKKVATYFGMQYWRESDQIVHSLRTAIVGADGRLAKLYRGNEWKPEEIIADLRGLAEVEAALKRPDVHRGVGTVESIEREISTVQLDHEEIKDMMPAMNMPYRVKDASQLDAVAPGDKVEFWLEPTPTGLVVIKIQKRKA